MEKITISDINIFPIAQQGSLIGWGSCVINDSLRISGIALHITPQGVLAVKFPAKRVGRGFLFYCQPLSPEIAELFRVAFEEEAKRAGLFNSEEEITPENGNE